MSYVIPAWRRWPLASGLLLVARGSRTRTCTWLTWLEPWSVVLPGCVASSEQRLRPWLDRAVVHRDMLCVYIFSAIISFLARCSLLQGAGAARWALIKLQLQAEKGSMRRRRAQPCGNRPRYTEALSVQQTSKPCTMRQQPAAGEPPIPCLPPPNKVRESESLD